VTARTTAKTSWPDATTPIEGVLELRVANLGTWGAWVPAGWRLSGALHASASIGGRLGAPQYTGRVEGSELGVRNFLEGVNITDGRVDVALQGTTARIERFTARAGKGTVRLEGEASFGEAPAARLRLVADRFEMLGRLDRRIVTSGSAALRLDAKTLALDGRFKVDEGLVDFTRADAPRLGDDVEVVRRPAAAPASNERATAVPAAAPARPPPAAPAPGRNIALDLRVDMGNDMRVRGRGLDAGLRGELHITSPGGRLAVNGTLSTVQGTYQAYGQKLAIDRGILTFVGPVENPRLDIRAIRPGLDIRVGVTVSGTALNPRIRLFSEPEMSDLNKLSWLVLGRESSAAGGAETALLQQAALALLSGEGPGATDRLIQSIGLDSVDIRQTQGAVKDTIVSLGKQISNRWYVGYEHGLNTATGTWQLIYRVAQRITVRAQAGGDNSIDVNWTLRWK
jgi:translocation and assembly module TamB